MRLHRGVHIDFVFTVAPESLWSAIFPAVDREQTRIGRALTGYLDPGTIARIAHVAAGVERTIDIGYRAKDLPAWLGRHARLKAQIGDAFAHAAPTYGLTTDISTRPEDVLTGSDWLRFLLSCRYTVGVEGGASVFDRDGSLRQCCERVLANRPGATFEELEAECFPGRDGEVGALRAVAAAPRGGATRTCQS